MHIWWTSGGASQASGVTESLQVVSGTISAAPATPFIYCLHFQRLSLRQQRQGQRIQVPVVVTRILWHYKWPSVLEDSMCTCRHHITVAMTWRIWPVSIATRHNHPPMSILELNRGPFILTHNNTKMYRQPQQQKSLSYWPAFTCSITLVGLCASVLVCVFVLACAIVCELVKMCVCDILTYPDHYDCKPDSCGPLAECTGDGGCLCVSGYEIPPTHPPTEGSYGCAGECVICHTGNRQ